MCMPGKERYNKICENCAGSLLQSGTQQKKGFQTGKQQTRHVLVSLQEHVERGLSAHKWGAVRFDICHYTAMI